MSVETEKRAKGSWVLQGEERKEELAKETQKEQSGRQGQDREHGRKVEGGVKRERTINYVQSITNKMAMSRGNEQDLSYRLLLGWRVITLPHGHHFTAVCRVTEGCALTVRPPGLSPLCRPVLMWFTSE